MLAAMDEGYFDASYYRRFYINAGTRACSQESIGRLVRFVSSYLDYLGVRPRDALDFGCGLGLWRDALLREIPELDYHGVEFSSHMCEAHGWAQGSVVDYQHGEPVDLVVCCSVLQYLPDAQARAAIANLARHADKALYLEVPTRDDWKHACDQDRSDGEVVHRDGDWYRRELGRHFDSCGGGLFLPKHSPVVLYELERGR